MICIKSCRSFRKTDPKKEQKTLTFLTFDAKIVCYKKRSKKVYFEYIIRK